MTIEQTTAANQEAILATLKDLLAGQPLKRETVPYGSGLSVTIRELTRQEALSVAEEDDPLKVERILLRWGMAEPEMSFQQVEQWQATASADAVGKIVEAIMRLSKIGLDEAEAEAALKSEVHRFP